MALPPDNSSKSVHNDRLAAQQDGFLREVDEALREDQMVTAVKRYGRPIGVAIIAGLIALAGYLVWDSNQKKISGARSEKIVDALDKYSAGPTSADAAVKELGALAKEGSVGSKTVAAMLAAAITQKQGKTEEAAKAFAAVAADASAPQPYRDLATLRELSIRFDALPPQQVIDRLKPMAVPGNAWFGSAGELTALAYLKLGKPDQAGPLFAAVAKDKGVPESLRARARLIAGQLGYDPGDEPALAAPAPKS